MATDPVCKTRVDEIDGRSVNHDGEVYFFCSEICKQLFQEDPELFAGDEYNNRRFVYTQAGELTLSR